VEGANETGSIGNLPTTFRARLCRHFLPVGSPTYGMIRDRGDVGIIRSPVRSYPTGLRHGHRGDEEGSYVVNRTKNE
jgi:hypothetical protein